MPATSPTLCDAITARGTACGRRAVGAVEGQHYCSIKSHKEQFDFWQEISPVPSETLSAVAQKCACGELAFLELGAENWCCSCCGCRWSRNAKERHPAG